jgi:hypothetical protein
VFEPELAMKGRFESPWFPGGNSGDLTELEVASGVVVGQGSAPTFGAHGHLDPIAVLRTLVRPLLASPPCVVAFSGGRDSSALLALLIDVARREGLPEPLAVTARWSDDEASDESTWQEEVARTIGVRNWEIIRPGTDLDLLGDEATSVLKQLGLRWPAPAYALRPMMRIGAGGSFLSGEGGDEAFGLWPYGRLWSTIRDRKVPRSSDLRALALGCAPRTLRRLRWRQNLPPYQHWIRPEALRYLAHVMADDRADDPLRWDRYQRVHRRRRGTELSLQTIDGLCALEGTKFVAPFLDEQFLAALGAWGGTFGRGDRTEVMSTLFSEVLPGPILARTSKATFGGVFWGPASRNFAHEWDGLTFQTDLVDPEALRQEWLAPVPVYGSAIPLQAAWLWANREPRTPDAAHPPTGLTEVP